MKKGIVLGIVFLFVMMSFTSISGIQINNKLTIPLGKGDILYVGGSGPGNYSTIQGAINDANNGDTVFVYDDSSPYYETVVIDTSINLIGENRDTTIIQANETDYCIKTTANGTQITGFTIKRVELAYRTDGAISIKSAHNHIWGNNIIDTDSDGVHIRKPASNNTISNNTIIGLDHGWGIHSYASSNNKVIGNHISGFYRGVEFGAGQNNIISGNTIENNNDAGVFLMFSDNSEISHNNFTNIRSGIWLFGSDYNKILNNNIRECGRGIISGGEYTNVSENNIMLCGVGIDCAGSHGKLYRNHVSNNDEDIIMEHGMDNLIIIDNYFEKGIVFGYETKLKDWNTHTIKNNHAYNGPIRYYKNMKDKVVPYNTAQVILANCTGFRIENLNLTGLNRGITLGFSSYNTIAHNQISNNDIGIELTMSDKNIIYNNTIVDGRTGIHIPVACRNNIIAGNFFVDNQWWGFWLNTYDNYKCEENFIVWNNISSLSDGIGISSSMSKERHNVIHHNNFIKGNRLAMDYCGGNIWDDGYPSGGNYWCDYDGEDDDGDGIGDSPYNITNLDEEVTGQDRYPLMDTISIGNIPPILINFSGPKYGKPLVEYSFFTEVADAEEDDIFCKLDWGDGTFSDWLGPFSSWDKICSSHIWQEDGSYEISISLKAGSVTNCSETFNVIIESEPPNVKILKPYRGVYVKNHQVLPRLLPICLVFGDINIVVNASDDISNVKRVDFYIDGKLKDSKGEEPFKFRWERDRIRFLIHVHVIKIVVVDNAGNTATERMIVRKFF